MQKVCQLRLSLWSGENGVFVPYGRLRGGYWYSYSVHSRQTKKGRLEIQVKGESCNGVESISGERRH